MMWAYPTIVRPFGRRGGLIEPPAAPELQTALLDTFGVAGALNGVPPDTTGAANWMAIDNFGTDGDMFQKSAGIVTANSTGTGVAQVQALADLKKARTVLSVGSISSTRRAAGLVWGADPARTVSTATRGCWLAWLWKGDGFDGVRVIYSPDLSTGGTVLAYYAVPGGLTTGDYELEADWSGGATTIRLNGAAIVEGLAVPTANLDQAGLAFTTVGTGALPRADYLHGWSL